MHSHERHELDEGHSNVAKRYDARAITRSLRVRPRREVIELGRPRTVQLLAAIYREGVERRSVILASVLFAAWLLCASQL